MRFSHYVPLVLLALFFLPMAAAWYLYHHAELVREHTINRGYLVTPARILPLTAFQPMWPQKHQWQLMYVRTQACHDGCREVLYRMRQLHTALGKYQGHVMRNFVSVVVSSQIPADITAIRQYPGTWETSITRDAWLQLMAGVPFVEQNGWYLVDPENRLLMRYDASTSSRDIYRDITRLLKAAQVE